RIEKVNHLKERLDKVYHKVVATNVCEFMEKNSFDLTCTEARKHANRHENERLGNADYRGRINVRRLRQLYHPRQPQPPGQISDKFMPVPANRDGRPLQPGNIYPPPGKAEGT